MSQQTSSVPMPTAQELAIPRQERPRRFNLESIGAMTFLFLFVLYFLIPFLWLVISATKSQADLFGTFGLWFAPNFNLFTNLQELFTYNNSIYGRWLLNTLLYAGVGSVVGTFLSAMAYETKPLSCDQAMNCPSGEQATAVTGALWLV